MMHGETALIVTAMKNEGPYILEWVAHHMAIGFDSFLVFTNDCDDGTDRILDRLSRLIDMQHAPNPKTMFDDRGNWQVMAHRYASLFNIYRDAGWICFTDVDEFIHVHVGDQTLDALYQAADRFDVISFTSVPYGSNGVETMVDVPVMTQFTRQSLDYDAMRAAGNRAQNAIKSMFHNRIKFSVRRNHRPRRADFSSTDYKWVDGSGNRFSAEWTDGKSKAVSPLDTCGLTQFNHYAIRSAEGFLVKVDRGDVAGVTRLDDDRRLAYWRSYDTAGTKNTAYATLLPKAQEIMDKLMADDQINALHKAAVSIHQAKAKAIRANPEMKPLLDGLGLKPLRSKT
jgi:hypothetical protein